MSAPRRLNVEQARSDVEEVFLRAGATGVGLALPLAVLFHVGSWESVLAEALAGVLFLGLVTAGIAWQIAAGSSARRARAGLVRKLTGVTLAYWAGASLVLWASWILFVGRMGIVTPESVVFGLVTLSGAWFWGAMTGGVVAVVVTVSTISRSERDRVPQGV